MDFNSHQDENFELTYPESPKSKKAKKFPWGWILFA